jgi:hypothetical protein
VTSASSRPSLARFGVAVFVLALNACAGHQAISALPNGGSLNGAAILAERRPVLPAAGNAPTGTIVVTLPPIAAGSRVSPRAVNLLSRGTRSVAGHFGKYTIAPIVVQASVPGCAAQSGGLVCTLHITVPSGGGSLELQTFANAKGTGLPLAMSSPIPYRVDPGVDNYPRSLTWSAIVRSLRLTVRPPELTITVGVNEGTSVVTAYAVDASGNAALGSRVVLADGHPAALKLTQAGLRSATFPFFNFFRNELQFNGQRSGKITFVASQDGKSPVLAPVTGTLVVHSMPGVDGLGSIIAAAGSGVVEFSPSASGATTPLRTLFGVGYAPYGADAQGNLWAGTTRYSNTGKILGSIKLKQDYVFEAATTDSAGNVYAVLSAQYSGEGYCNYQQWIVEYAAGDYSGRTIRSVPYKDGCTATAIAVDASGYIYTYTPGLYYYPTPTLSKWPANASGNVKPLSSVTVPPISNMISDASGNLYAIEQAQSGSSPGTLVEFPAGSSTPQTVLPGVSVTAFTMDSTGNTYAEVPTSANAFQIEEFAPGSTSPSNTISSTSLTNSALPPGITVVP